jgi:hypothetical protein
MSTDLKLRWVRVLFSTLLALGTVLTLLVLLSFVRIGRGDAAVAEGIRPQ